MRAKGQGKLPLVQRLSKDSVIPSVQARMKAVWLGKKKVYGIILTVENNRGNLKGMQREKCF